MEVHLPAPESCPFCGSSSVGIDMVPIPNHAHSFNYNVYCEECGSTGAKIDSDQGIYLLEIIRKAIEVWNRRAP